MIEGFGADLPRESASGILARRLVERHCGGRVEKQTVDDLKLVVSELVNNAYVHGRGQIRLRLESDDERLRVEVMDEGENAAIKIRRAGARDGGSGLRLVDALCPRWGAYEGSTHVWADLPLARRQADTPGQR